MIFQVLLVRQLQHREPVGDGGAVQEDVDLAVVLDDLGDRRLDVVDLLNLADGEHAFAALLHDLFRDRCCAVGVHVEDGDLCAFGGEELGGRASDVPAAAYDESDPAVEFTHG